MSTIKDGAKLRSGTEMKKNKSVLSNRNFARLFSGRLISSLGDYTFDFAIVWYILRNGGTSLQTGVVLMCSVLPQVLLGPFAGVVADRIDRKKILVSMNLLRGVIISCVGILMFLDMMPFWTLCLLLLLSDVCCALFNPACSSLIPNIVEETEYTKANSMDSLATNLSRIVGPLLGGFVYNYFGMANVVLINAISFFISGLLLIFMHVNKEKKVLERVDISVKAQMIEGFTYIRNRKGLYQLFKFYVVLNFLSMPIVQIYFPYAYNNILFASTTQLSITNFAFGVGFVAGSLITSFLPQRQKFHNRICNSFFISCSMVLGFAIPLFPKILENVSTNVVVVFYSMLAFICGTFMMMGNIPLFVIFQRDVDDQLRGRVFSLMNTFTNGAIPLGYLLAGYIVGQIPMHILISFIAIILVFLNILIMSSKSIKEL